MHHESPLEPARVSIVLRDIADDRIAFSLIAADGQIEREVVARVSHDRAQFPALGTDTSETTGSDELDAEIQRRASEELVRHRAATSGAWA